MYRWLKAVSIIATSSRSPPVVATRPSITALLGVNPRKHVWSRVNQLDKILTGMSRHDYFSVSNWESKVKPLIESATADRVKGKP